MDLDFDDHASSISTQVTHNNQGVLIDVMEVDKVNKGKSILADTDTHTDAWHHHIIKDSSLCSASVYSNDVAIKSSTFDSNNNVHIDINLNNSAFDDGDDGDYDYMNDDDHGGDADDFSYCDDDDDDGDGDADADDDDQYLYEEDHDDYLAMQSQFDNVDLPPGVEANFSWLKEPPPTATSDATSTIPSSSQLKTMSGSGILDFAGSHWKASASGLSDNKVPAAAAASSSSAATCAEYTSSGELVDKEGNGIIDRLKRFKQFDTLEDFSDHHYCHMNFSDNQCPDPKGWAKRIQEEWKILEKDLPDTIFVRVYESRMELLRAVIVGPAGTPYHDGLFVFDFLFPPTYPKTPPMVYYYSGGLRLNPNLYECGKVCLSLLGTWSGKQNEMWIPGTSTMLQVLVSIQALILNAKPFFNEPGYEISYTGAEGDRRSRKYNEDTFILSLKTMVYTLRRPPKYFEDYVIGHFHIHAHDILVACKAYLDGATVGFVAVKDGVAKINKEDGNTSVSFQGNLKTMINSLITTFTRCASIDCEKFRVEDGK